MKKFTLVELVVSIVILAILAAIILPQFAGVKSNANSSKNAANLKNIQTATSVYHLETNEYPVKIHQPFSTYKEIDFTKINPDLIKNNPKLDKGYNYYVDEVGTVHYLDAIDDFALKWLKESTFIVEDPSHEDYKGTNPPVGMVYHNYEMKDYDDFTNHKGETTSKSFTAAITGISLLDVYQDRKDEAYLNRAIHIGNFLKNDMISKGNLYGTDLTLMSPQVKYNRAGNSWIYENGYLYSQDSAIGAAFLIRLSEVTGDASYAEVGRKLLDSLYMLQSTLAGHEEYGNKIKGALPMFTINNQDGTLAMSWGTIYYPTDIAYFMSLASEYGYNYFGDSRYKELGDNYFNFLETSFENYSAISPEGFPYEYIAVHSADNIYGLNENQVLEGIRGTDQPFTTDQFFYLSLGLAKKGSPYAKEFYDKAKELLIYGEFAGQYNPDGTVDVNASDIETLNLAMFIELGIETGLMTDAEVYKYKERLFQLIIKSDKVSVNGANAWSPKERVVESLVSAYVGRTLIMK